MPLEFLQIIFELILRVFGNWPLEHLMVFFFLSSWPPLLWGAITFSILFHFWWFLVHQMRQEEKFKFCLNKKNQWSPPFGSSLLWTLKCYSCNWIATNEQLKDLTHMFCLQISCYKTIWRRLVFLCSHIRIHVSIWDEF
jgi:hypothetical protein